MFAVLLTVARKGLPEEAAFEQRRDKVEEEPWLSREEHAGQGSPESVDMEAGGCPD